MNINRLRLNAMSAVAGVAIICVLSISSSFSTSSAQANGLLNVDRNNSVFEANVDDERAAVAGLGEWQQYFANISTEIGELFPSEFTVAVADVGIESGEIRFKADVPAGAQEMVGRDGRIRLIGYTGYSRVELSQLSSQLAEAAAREVRAKVVGAGFGFNPDIENKVIHVSIGGLTVAAGEGLSDEIEIAGIENLEGALQSVIDSQEGALSEFLVELDRSRVPVDFTSDADGGRKLVGVNGSYCTGGFPIKSNSGPELGILTAGHCPGTGSYSGIANFFYPPVPYSQSTTTEYPGGDFRWDHSRYMLSGTTYIGTGTRVFGAAAVAPINTTACSYGVTSGYRCGLVMQADASYSFLLNENGKWYTVGPLGCVSAFRSEGGDSGGPWFWGATAYGVTSGRTTPSNACWSHVTFALQRFGIHLWQG